MILRLLLLLLLFNKLQLTLGRVKDKLSGAICNKNDGAAQVRKCNKEQSGNDCSLQDVDEINTVAT